MALRSWMIGSVMALTTALSACVSVLSEPQAADLLYRLEGRGQVTGLTASVIIREPEAPRLMGGEGMVSEGSDGGLRLLPGAEWTGRSTRQIQLAIVDSFDLASDGAALLPETGAKSEYELASRLRTLELRGTEATCAMSVSLIVTKTRALVKQGEILERAQAATDRTQARAQALQKAGDQCAAKAAEFVRDNLPSTAKELN